MSVLEDKFTEYFVDGCGEGDNMDVDEYDMITIFSLPLFDENCSFYYDETGTSQV